MLGGLLFTQVAYTLLNRNIIKFDYSIILWKICKMIAFSSKVQGAQSNEPNTLTKFCFSDQFTPNEREEIAFFLTLSFSVNEIIHLKTENLMTGLVSDFSDPLYNNDKYTVRLHLSRLWFAATF